MFNGCSIFLLCLLIARFHTGLCCYCKHKLLLDIIKAYDWRSLNLWKNTDSCFSHKNFLAQIAKFGSSINLRDDLPDNSTLLNEEIKNIITFIPEIEVNFFQKINSISNMNNQAWAILIQNEDDIDHLKEISMSIYLDSRFMLFHLLPNCSSHTYSLYRVGPRVRSYITEKGGGWSISYGFKSPNLGIDNVERRYDFMGYPMFGVGVKVFPHFTTYLPDSGVTGFVGDLITILKKAHNFTLTYKVLEGYAYGKVIGKTIKDNKWNGMVGELQNKKVDFTVSELSITRERSEIVSYTQPIYVISRKMYAAAREDTKGKLLTYTAPMDSKLYMTTCGMMAILIISMKVASITYQKTLPHLHDVDDVTFATGLWYMVSAITQQGSPSPPNFISTRMLYWYGSMLALLVYVSYSATLMSYLAVVLPITLPFSDFYGLVKLSSWDAGNVKDDLFEVIASQTCAIETQKEECRILYQLWNDVILKSPGNLVKTYNEGLRRSMEMNYVFIGVDVTTNNYIKQLPREEACVIKELPTQYITGGIGIGMQYKSPFLSSFDNSLMKLKEMGVVEKLVKKWLKVEIICQSDTIISADIIDTASLFVLLIIGIAISFLLFFSESVWRRQNVPFMRNISGKDSVQKFVLQ